MKFVTHPQRSNNFVIFGRIWKDYFDFFFAEKGEQLACAVSVQSKIAGKSLKVFEFSLVWHMPVIHFGEGKVKYRKYYTRFFGENPSAAGDIASYSLRRYPEWEREIENWQNPVLDDIELPSWFKSALFNETYFVSDGGSIWIDLDEDEKKLLDKNDPRYLFVMNILFLILC